MKRIVQATFVVAFFTTIASFVSCEYNKAPEPIPTPTGFNPDTVGCNDTAAVVSYSKTIKRIVTTRCNNGIDGAGGCHGNKNLADVNFQSYEGITQYPGEYLLQVIKHENVSDSKKMPQFESKLPDCQIQKFESWINNGSPNN